MPSFFQLQSYLTYWLEAVDKHSLHSPFFYNFYCNVLYGKSNSPYFNIIETHRKKLLSENRSIEIVDLGSGSSHFKNNTRKLATIARTSLSTPAFSQFYNRLIHHYNATIILELGTSLGINALYLAEKKDATVYTFEGAPAIAAIARQTFTACQASNIKLIEGDITQTLPSFLQINRKPDIVFMDANHRYEFTKQYIEWLLPHVHHKTILILDDIYYSREMKKVWMEIRQHDLVYGSADIFRCGLVFFDPSLNKQHVVLQFNH